MYQRNTTNNDNRRLFIIQNHYFTYQRKGNHELQIQALNHTVADLQNQINNINTGSSGSDPHEPEIGTMQIKRNKTIIYLLYTQICGCEYLYRSTELVKPCPKLHFSKHAPRQKKKHKNTI